MRPVTPTDDKQLWRVSDVLHGKHSSWPLYATPSKEANGHAAYLVELAMPIENAAQAEFVFTRLNLFCFEHENNRWLIRPVTWEKGATKCNGITPAYYLKWESEPVAAIADTVAPADPPEFIDESFVRFACNYAGFTDFNQANLYWNLFAYNAVRWLLEKGKPLKLGFCTLYALPYRANWKAILHARWPQAITAFRRTHTERDAALEAIGFTESLFSADLIEALPGNPQPPPINNPFGWTLEVRPAPRWDQEVRRVETEIAANSPTPVSYLWRWSKLIKDKHEQILSIFNAWLEKAARPLGAMDESRGGDNRRLVPRLSRGRVRPSAAPVPITRYTTAPHETDDNPLAAPAPDAPAPAGVQEVPDATFAIKLLRPHRGVDKAGS